MFSKLNKKSTQTWSYDDHDLEMELPSDWWQDSEIKDPLTLYKGVDGSGALQITFNTSTSLDGKKPQMDEHFKTNRIDRKTVQIHKIGEWDVYQYDTEGEGHFVKNFNLVKPDVFIYATFVYGSETNRTELDEAVEIIKSIQVSQKITVQYYNQDFADSLIGKYVIVGYTHQKKSGKIVKYEQKHGVVLRVNENEGVVIQPLKSDASFSLPPDFRTWERAKKGEYKLKSTGEVIVDPDYLTNWIKNVE